MTIAVFVDPTNCTIERVYYENTQGLLPKCKEFIGTTDLGHCTPIPRLNDGVICGNFHDEWGMNRHLYGIIIKGYNHPIMGPSCFYAEIITADEHGEPKQVSFDFPYRFIPGTTLLWMMKDPKTMTIIRRPEDHVLPKDPKAHMN